MPGAGAAVAALALLIVIVSAVFHHRLRLADEAAHPPADTTSHPDAVAPAAQAPRNVRRIVALPYALFAAAVVALFAIGSALTFWSTSGSGSGGIGSVSAGLSEALVETTLIVVVVLGAVVVISTFGRRPR